jgi:hypothetical protein
MCKIIYWIFLTLYVGALVLFVIGNFGLFNSPSGPLAGIYLVPLGLPWNLVVDYVPEGVRPWLGAGAPIINLVILRALCRKFGAA